MGIVYRSPETPILHDLEPETFEADTVEGRASVHLAGGARVDITKMMMMVVVTGDEGPRVLMHPQFEDNVVQYMRHLSGDLLTWAQNIETRTAQGEDVGREIPRPAQG